MLVLGPPLFDVLPANLGGAGREEFQGGRRWLRQHLQFEPWASHPRTRPAPPDKAESNRLPVHNGFAKPPRADVARFGYVLSVLLVQDRANKTAKHHS